MKEKILGLFLILFISFCLYIFTRPRRNILSEDYWEIPQLKSVVLDNRESDQTVIISDSTTLEDFRQLLMKSLILKNHSGHGGSNPIFNIRLNYKSQNHLNLRLYEDWKDGHKIYVRNRSLNDNFPVYTNNDFRIKVHQLFQINTDSLDAINSARKIRILNEE